MDIRLKKNNMRHYFISSEHNAEDYFEFKQIFQNKEYVFKSCADVFSKNQLDYGSLVLVKTVLENREIFGGKIMDMCCGYGTIAILLDGFLNAEFYLSDINETAIELAKMNIVCNKSKIKKDNIFQGNLFDCIVDNFDHIVSNPPIKVGKKYLLSFANQSYDHLVDGGTLTVVIKKNLGADSFKKYLIDLFGNCEVWERDKGYYILHSIK